MTAALGIDLASRCGWAVADSAGVLHSGTWRLKPPASSCDKTKELTFLRRLEATRAEYPDIEFVAYEEVIAHERSGTKRARCPGCGKTHQVAVRETNVLAAQVYGALRGILLMWADLHGLQLHKVAVGTLKRFATGNGRASKEEMVDYAKLRWPEQDVATHDQADALHVLDWLRTEVLGHRGKVRVDRHGQLELAPGSETELPEVEF